MTRDEARQLLPIIQAYSEGRKIEFFSHAEGEGWVYAPILEFLYHPSRYRIKPEPIECWAVVDAGGVVIRSYNHQSNAADYAATSHNFRVARLREVT